MAVFTKRRVLRAAAVVFLVAGIVLFRKWRYASKHGGQKVAEPFRIADNFYYVGANDISAFLITSPQGHILLDGGYPGTPPLIMASIAKLGFNIRDVKVLLNSEPHYDHAGGLAELQRASGAELWASEGSADAIAHGGLDPHESFLSVKLLIGSGLLKYPAPRVDHRFKDGAVVRVGTTALTAHITPGHTRACTTWTFNVHDSGRVLHVVSACSLVVGMARLVPPERYPGVREDFERTFAVLRALPEDIWVTSHAKLWGRYRKYSESLKAADKVAPFIDHEGYAAYIADGEKYFRRELVKQQSAK